VVVTQTGGTPELVEPEINGLVFDWTDVDRLTAHLRRLAGDRALVRRMGEASRRRAGEFSWEMAAQRYGEILSQLLRSPLGADTGFIVQAKPKI
jgi:glycosyltransferase involved in cell wall biosynthesis